MRGGGYRRKYHEKNWGKYHEENILNKISEGKYYKEKHEENQAKINIFLPAERPCKSTKTVWWTVCNAHHDGILKEKINACYKITS